jgi:hypothetical protein
MTVEAAPASPGIDIPLEAEVKEDEDHLLEKYN